MPKSENRIEVSLNFGTVDAGHKKVFIDLIQHFAKTLNYDMPKLNKSEKALENLKQCDFPLSKEVGNR